MAQAQDLRLRLFRAARTYHLRSCVGARPYGAGSRPAYAAAPTTLRLRLRADLLVGVLHEVAHGVRIEGITQTCLAENVQQAVGTPDATEYEVVVHGLVGILLVGQRQLHRAGLSQCVVDIVERHSEDVRLGIPPQRD